MNSWQKPKQGRNFVLVDQDCDKPINDIISMFPVKTDFYSYFTRPDLRVTVFFVSFSDQLTLKQLQHTYPKFSIQIAPDIVPKTISNYLIISNLSL